MKITNTKIMALGAILLLVLLSACASYPKIGTSYLTNYQAYRDGTPTEVKLIEAEITASPEEVYEKTIETLKELAGKDLKKLQIVRASFGKIGASSTPVVENGKKKKIVVMKFDPEKPGALVTNFKTRSIGFSGLGITKIRSTVVYIEPMDGGTKVAVYSEGTEPVTAAQTVEAIQAKF